MPAAPPKSAKPPATRFDKQFAPLDRAHQDEFVATVRDIARVIIFLSLGIVLGVMFGWISGMNRRR